MAAATVAALSGEMPDTGGVEGGLGPGEMARVAVDEAAAAKKAADSDSSDDEPQAASKAAKEEEKDDSDDGEEPVYKAKKQLRKRGLGAPPSSQPKPQQAAPQ